MNYFKIMNWLKKLKIAIYLILFIEITSFNSLTFAKVEAIIFDCDGILVDTEYLKFIAWKQALNLNGINFSIEDYTPLIGYSSQEILSTVLDVDNKESREIIDKKNEIYRSLHTQGVPLFMDAINFLKKVIDKKKLYKYKVAIVSSASKEEINSNMKYADIDTQFIDLIASGEEDLNHIVDSNKNKPKPYIYLYAAQFLSVSPKNCLVFEDTNAGVTAAFKAGMKVFAVPNNLTAKQDFSDATNIIQFKNLNLERLISEY